MNKTKKKLLILIPLFIFLDQLSKKWMLNNIFDSQIIIEINKYLNFMIIVTSGILLFLISWFVKTKSRNLSLSLSFIISGAIGNLVDRLNHKAVVDFIDIHIGNHHWPAFNFADSYITIGAFIYVFTIFTSQKDNIA